LTLLLFGDGHLPLNSNVQ